MKSEEFKKLVDLLENEEFKNRTANCENGEELRALFNEYEIEIDAVEANEVFDELIAKFESDELSVEDLDFVSGGSVVAGLGIIAAGAVATYMYIKLVAIPLITKKVKKRLKK